MKVEFHICIWLLVERVGKGENLFIEHDIKRNIDTASDIMKAPRTFMRSIVTHKNTLNRSWHSFIVNISPKVWKT